MAFMNWSATLETGHAQIDREHKALVDALNNLHAAMKQGKGKDEISKTLKFLRDYTVNHFKMEEGLMASSSYPESRGHAAYHADLVSQVSDLTAKFEAGKTLMTIEVMDFLERWLKDHILSEDKKLAAWLNR